jgi:hypothetical protein
MFPDKDIFGPLSRFLLNPVDEIQEKVDEFMKKNKFNQNNVIGVQIRSNLKEESIQWFQDYNIFWDCFENIKKKNSLMFISTDNSTVREIAKSKFGDNLIYYDQVLNFDRNEETVKNALVDVLILSQSNQIIYSKLSTFGNFAHGYSSKIPFVVKFDKKKLVCENQKHSQPDFHWQFRSNRMKCN